MDSKLKTCSGEKLLPQSRNANANDDADRFTSLPDELLGEILSMLPTKDAVVASISSKRMRKAFSWISSFNLDDSPICLCIKHCHLVEGFPLFESFVDNLLMRFSPPNAPLLTHFRLYFGKDRCPHFDSNGNWLLGHSMCDEDCFPDVLPERLNEWLSYPIALAHGGGLRELDLAFFLRRPCQFELPPSLFTCQSLHVLKLESNLVIDGSRIPMITLPNLEHLYLRRFIFNDDDFVTRLVSSCPILENLDIRRCLWKIGDRVSISSPSLRRLFLVHFRRYKDPWKSTDLLLFDTPNLQYLCYYAGDVANRYSISPMNALVKAHVNVNGHRLSLEAKLSLITAVSHVPELFLGGTFIEHFKIGGELRDQQAVFRNLRTLELGGCNNGRRDILLLSILHRTPSLETLVFRSLSLFGLRYLNGVDVIALEAEGWRTADPIPSCCLTHLKRVVFRHCTGSEQELNMIKFLLAKSSVLKELVLRMSSSCVPPKLDQFENIVKELPTSSNSCIITVQR